jgi:hypothetical protein
MPERVSTEPPAGTAGATMSVSGPADPVQSELPDDYAFVMNVGRLTDARSFEIAPGHELRRATKNEIAIIKDCLRVRAPAPQWKYMSLWEQQWPHTGDVVNMLSESDWRYHVIAFKGSNAMMLDLLAAFDLAPLELEVGFIVRHLQTGDELRPGVSWNAGRLFHVLEDAEFNPCFFVDVSEQEIETIQQVHARLREHNERLMDVRHLVTQVGELKALPHRSALRFLGYFAILESLLTHAPKASDPYDSITRQVRRKLMLLDHRWTHPIDYSPFCGATPETVWSKMYSYRSLVAHGGEPKFEKDLKVLQNEETALKLIKETVKAVIRQTLSEPQLLLDLREC